MEEKIMDKREYSFLLNIGFDKFVPYNIIIGIFNASDIGEFIEKITVKEKILASENLPVKSYIYCEGGYLIGSPIESKTLKKRYEKFQNEINGFSDNKDLYVKIN
jgi:hypothetical protein